MADTRLGKVGITVKEPWAADISYEVLDITLFAVEDGGDGCSYTALKPNQGVRPGTDPTTWTKSSQAGQSIYDLAVKYKHFEGTEAEFEAEYQVALQAARTAAEGASAVENQVQAAEASRVAAETQRASAESERISAESERVSAEDLRIAAEQTRESEELIRQDQETERAENERTRTASETTRENAETTRQSNELSRTQQFQALKTDMQTAIQNVDAKAAEIAEDIEGYEQNEAGRVSAEQGRVAAETARAQQSASDHTRAESDHTTATSDHQQAGSDHTRAEADHTTASEDHTTAASDHSTAGTDHTRAEQDHTTAESDHGTAESDHTRAESDHAIVQGYDTRLTNVEGEVSQLGQKVNLVNEVSEPVIEKDVDVSLRSLRNYGITDSLKYGTSSTYKHCLIPVEAGDTFKIVSSDDADARIAWLTSNDTPSGGGTPPLVNGTQRVFIIAGETAIVEAPDGAKYMYVYRGASSTSYKETPKKVEKIIPSSKIKKVTAISANLINPDDIQTGQVTNSGALQETASYYHTVYIPVTEGKTYTVLCRSWINAYYFRYVTFYDSFKSVISGGLSTVGKSFTAPSGAAYAVVTLYNSHDSTSIPPEDYGLFEGAAPSFVPFYDSILTVPDVPLSQKPRNCIASADDVRNGSRIVNSQTISTKWQIGGIGRTGSSSTSITAANILQSTRMLTMMSAVPGGKVSSVDTDANDVVSIYCYSGDYSFIDSTIVGNTFPDGTAWIRLAISNSGGVQTRDRQIILADCPKVEFAKLKYSSDASNAIIFDVEIPNVSGEYAQPIKTVDTGRIILPYNYSRNGTPSRLVLWCHGTQGYGFNGTLAYADYLKIFSKNGFAVADCSGITAYYGSDLYEHQVDDLVDSKNSPLLIACYAALVKCVGAQFNIDTSGIYIASKSAGGLVATQLSYTSPFHVRAVANLAPALCMVGQSWRVTNSVPLLFWLNQYGVDTSGWDNKTSEQKRQVLADAYSKVYGYDPIYEGTSIDSQAAIALMLSKSYPGSASELGALYAADAELMAMFDEASKFVPVPTKIWHAADDATVPYFWSQKYVDMAHRGNGICELRTMPSNTGGHHSTDNDEDAPHIDYTCENGDVYDVPLAFAEALDWFKKW